MKGKQVPKELTRQSERLLIRAATEAMKTDFPNPERRVSIDLRHSQMEFTEFYSLRVC